MPKLLAPALPFAALAVAVPALALAEPAPAAAPAPDAKAVFAQRYADLRKAMASGEANPILAILTPDFTFTDRRGQSRKADDMVSMAARMAMMGDSADRRTTTTIASVTMPGADTADVEQTTDTTMTREGRDGQTHRFEMISTSLDHWVLQDGVWRLQKEVPQSMTLKRDGVEFQPGQGRPGGRRRGHGGPPSSGD